MTMIDILCIIVIIIIILLLNYLFNLLTAIELSLGGSSPYTSTDITSTHITKTPTHYKIHTYTQPHITKQFKITTIRDKHQIKLSVFIYGFYSIGDETSSVCKDLHDGGFPSDVFTTWCSKFPML
jgi:hypothetical protein